MEIIDHLREIRDITTRNYADALDALDIAKDNYTAARKAWLDAEQELQEALKNKQTWQNE